MAQDVTGVEIRSSHRADDRADWRVFTQGERFGRAIGEPGTVDVKNSSTHGGYGMSRPCIRLIAGRRYGPSVYIATTRRYLPASTATVV